VVLQQVFQSMAVMAVQAVVLAGAAVHIVAEQGHKEVTAVAETIQAVVVVVLAAQVATEFRVILESAVMVFQLFHLGV
jgi:hypothetical protein